MDRIPFWLSFGVGAPAREPSPRNSGPSSHRVIWAASLIVNGRTLTVTLIEEAPSEAAMLEGRVGSTPSREVSCGAGTSGG